MFRSKKEKDLIEENEELKKLVETLEDNIRDQDAIIRTHTSKEEAKIHTLKTGYESQINALQGKNTMQIETMRHSHALENAKRETEHRLELTEKDTAHKIEVEGLHTEIETLNQSFDDDVDNEIQKRDKIREEEHRKIVKACREEKDLAIKNYYNQIEDAKAHARREVKAEFGNKLEQAEKRAYKAEVELADARGQIVILKSSQEFFKGKQEMMVSTMEAVVKALPKISAEFSSPEIHIENNLPGGSKGGENKGNQEKKN